jgi:hypothetical protein
MLIHYSVSATSAAAVSGLVAEFALSLWSLRRGNPHVPVVVFAYDDAAAIVEDVARQYRAELVDQGSYARRLADLCPEGWPVLARYPTLHKFLNFPVLSGVERALYCDCDTIFAGDVAVLFDRYAVADVYAREEVHSALSSYGPERSFLDEPALRRLAADLRVAVVAPFNTGVVLVNHGRGAQLAQLDAWLVQCVWHFMVWMSLHPEHVVDRRYGTLDGIESAGALATHEQLARALPYPSANQWIVEEMATWLALGAVQGLVTGVFSPQDAPQNGEPDDPALATSDWLVHHYFSTDITTAMARLSARRPVPDRRS